MTAPDAEYQDLTALLADGLGAACRRLMHDLEQAEWIDLDMLADVLGFDPDEFSEAVCQLLNTGYMVVLRDPSTRQARLTRRGRAAMDRARAYAT